MPGFSPDVIDAVGVHTIIVVAVIVGLISSLVVCDSDSLITARIIPPAPQHRSRCYRFRRRASTAGSAIRSAGSGHCSKAARCCSRSLICGRYRRRPQGLAPRRARERSRARSLSRSRRVRPRRASLELPVTSAATKRPLKGVGLTGDGHRPARPEAVLQRLDRRCRNPP